MLDLEPLVARWQLALDATERALRTAGAALSAAELAERWSRLAAERRLTAAALAGVGRPYPACSPRTSATRLSCSSRQAGQPSRWARRPGIARSASSPAT